METAGAAAAGAVVAAAAGEGGDAEGACAASGRAMPVLRRAADAFDAVNDESVRISIYSDVNVLFEYVPDAPETLFAHLFLAAHFWRIRSFEDAVAHGVFDRRFRNQTEPITAWSLSNPRCDMIFVNKRHYVVRLKQSHIDNARTVTAHGKYNVRGLDLPWDTAVWGVLKAASASSQVNPFSLPGSESFRRLIRAARFRPEVSYMACCLARALALGQYAFNAVVDYRNQNSLSRHMRNVCGRLFRLYARLDEAIGRLGDGEDRDACLRLTPAAVCAAAGLPRAEGRVMTHAVHRDFVLESSRALLGLYARFCGCGDCARRYAGDLGRGVRDNGVDVESAYLLLRDRPDIGHVSLPPLRHLTDAERSGLCDQFRRDLLFDAWGEKMYYHDMILPVRGFTWHDPDRRFVVHIAENICLCLSVLRALHRLVRSEMRSYARLIREELRTLAQICENKAYCFRNALVDDDEHPDMVALYEGLARFFDGVRFGNGLGGTFCAALACLEECSHRVPDYRAIPEFRIREEVLVHHFFVRRLYSACVDETFVGERFLPYFLEHGDPGVQDAAAIRAGAVELLDAELCFAPEDPASWTPEATRSYDVVPWVEERLLLGGFVGLHVKKSRYSGCEQWSYPEAVGRAADNYVVL